MFTVLPVAPFLPVQERMASVPPPSGMRARLRRALSLAAVGVFLLSGGTAGAETVGDWAVETGSEKGVFAAATNESGNVLGVFCSPDGTACAWVLVVPMTCDRGTRYPVLANSDAGAAQLEVLCDGQVDGGRFTFSFTGFEQISRLIGQSTRVGFAFPLQQDEFRIARFNTRGAPTAVAALRAATRHQQKPDQQL